MAQGVQQYLGATSPTNIPYVEGSGDSAAALGQALEGAAAVGVELYKQKVVGDLSDAVNGVPDDVAASEDNVSRMRDLAAKMSAAKTVPEAEALRKEMEKYAALERQGAMTGGIVAAQNLVKNAIQRNPQFAAEFIEVYKDRFGGLGGSGGGGSGGSGGSKTYGAMGVPNPYEGMDDNFKEWNRTGMPPDQIRMRAREVADNEYYKAQMDGEIIRFGMVHDETLSKLADIQSKQVFATALDSLNTLQQQGNEMDGAEMSAIITKSMETGWRAFVDQVNQKTSAPDDGVRVPDGWMEKQRKKFMEAGSGILTHIDKFHDPKEVLDAMQIRRQNGLAEMFKGNEILYNLAVADPRGMAELLINRVPKIVLQATGEKAGMRAAIESIAKRGNLEYSVALAYIDYINKNPVQEVNTVGNAASTGQIPRTADANANATSAIIAAAASMDSSVADPEKRSNLHRGAQSALSATLLDRVNNPKATPIPMPAVFNGQWHKKPEVANLLRTDMEFRKMTEDNYELQLRLKFGEIDNARQQLAGKSIQVDYGAVRPFSIKQDARSTQPKFDPASATVTNYFVGPVSSFAYRLNDAYEQFSSYAKTPEERKAYIDKLSSIYLTPGEPPPAAPVIGPTTRAYDPETGEIK